ncbi:MAG TPA: carbon-nitrogen hydrolase family protein [Woeseiaceae bacterium]|nr:carbon-nitrogen hydrolase family protein [Woeseiaceae bacterium]
MSKIAIAGLQLEGMSGDNQDSIESEIDIAMARFPWVDMVLLGELNPFGADPKYAQPMPGPFEERFAEVARRHSIWLIPGSIVEKDGNQLFNTTPVINPDGEVIARYRKMFPWCPYENGITPGKDFVVFDVPDIGRFGVSICYDMWFPETIRTLAWMGAEVILHPTLTSTIDREAEHCMVRASAAMNQCYFVDINVAGRIGVGESIVAGPGGEIIHRAGKGREIIPVKLDLDYVRDVRENGWHNLSQPLKSFRDSEVVFPQYRDGYASESLRKLGPVRRAGPRDKRN